MTYPLGLNNSGVKKSVFRFQCQVPALVSRPSPVPVGAEGVGMAVGRVVDIFVEYTFVCDVSRSLQ